MPERFYIFILAMGLCLAAAGHAFAVAGSFGWGVIFTVLTVANFAGACASLATD